MRMRLPSPLSLRSLHRRGRLVRMLAGVNVLALTMLVTPSVLPQLGATAKPTPRPVKPSVKQVGLAPLLSGGSTTPAPSDKALAARAQQLTPKSKTTLGSRDRVLTIATTAKLVGLSWAPTAALASTTSVAWRSKSAQGTWTGWTPVTAASNMVDPAANRSGRAPRVTTDPMWVGDATAVQLRFPEGSVALRSARLEQIDPGTSPADVLDPAPGPGAAAAMPSRPRIYSRAEWGADESLRNGCVPSIGETVKGVVVHHDAGSNSYTASESAGIVRSILAYHTQVAGWCDIGYNMIVDKYGQAFEGRYGGLNLPVQGAHAMGFNENTFGIMMLGNYMTAQPTPAGLDILARAIAWRLGTSYRDGSAQTTWTGGASGTRYPTVGTYTLPTIIGHRDLNYTECPGVNLYAQLPAIRRTVAALNSYGTSPIYQRYASTGGPDRWGPVWMSETTLGAGSAESVMTGGARFYATPSNGVRYLGPGLDGIWRRQGFATWGGYPWTDEIATPSGWYAELTRGKTLTTGRGGYATWTEGAVRWYWVNRANGSYGVLRMPSGPIGLAAGLWNQRFDGGTVYFDQARNVAVRTEGGMDAYYRSRGFLGGSMGVPVGDVVATSTGAKQQFSAGVLRWSRATNRITFTAA